MTVLIVLLILLVLLLLLLLLLFLVLLLLLVLLFLIVLLLLLVITCIENQIISQKQAAYIRGDSTVNQLLYMVHKIKQGWTNNKVTH